MKKKKIGQKSRRYFRDARELYYQFRSAEDLLETSIDKKSQEAIEFVQRVNPWVMFYSIPAKDLTIITLSIMGFLEGLENAVKSQDPLDGVMKFCKDLLDGKHDDEYEATMQEFEKMVGRVGFEPTTNGLKVQCSTN